MAKIDDCLKKMRAAGAVIDAGDEANIRAYIEQGMDEMTAVRRVFIERAKNVIDIMGRARREGAEVRPYRDTYDAIVTKRQDWLARTMQRYMDERNALGFKLTDIQEEMNRLADEASDLETFGNLSGVETADRRADLPGGQKFDLQSSSSAELMQVFERLLMQDEWRRKRGEETLAQRVGLEGDTPEAMLESFRAKQQRWVDLINEANAVRRSLRQMEHRVQSMMDREVRNPTFDSLDADGNYTMNPGGPGDSVAEKIGEYLYRAFRGEHGPDEGQPAQGRMPTIAFAGDRETAVLYAMEPNNRADVPVAPRVLLADLEIKKPLQTEDQDPFLDFGQIIEAVGMEAALELASDWNFIDSVTNTEAWYQLIDSLPESQQDLSVREILERYPEKANELYGLAYVALSSQAFVDALKANGFDGAIIGGMGANAGMTEYHVFDAAQVRGQNQVLEERQQYPAMPWRIQAGKESTGDLYIRRHGPNAGQVFRERQSENDFAVTLNQDLLLPDYMFYVFQYLQPMIAQRARGTAQQAIRKSDIEEVLIQFFQSQVREDQPPPAVRPRQGQLFADKNIPVQRRENEAKMNYRATVSGTVETDSFPVGLTRVDDAEQAAHVLAPIRRNAQEVFMGLVLGENNEVLGIIDHSKGGVAGSSVYPEIVAGHVLQIPGARKVWWAHNHPSGVLMPSNADEMITRRIEELMDGSGVEIQGHLLFGAGRDRFAIMDRSGTTLDTNRQILPRPRNLSVPIYTRRFRGRPQPTKNIRDPDSARAVIQDIGLKNGIILLDNRNQVLGVLEMTAEEMKRLRGTGQLDRLLRAQADLNAAAFLSVTDAEDMDAASNMASFSKATAEFRHLDHMFLDATGAWRSTAETGRLGPRGRTFNQDIMGFKSGVLEAAINLPQEKGSAAQMVAMLKKQPGVKKEEMDWIQLEDWIEARGQEAGVVTKSEIVEFVRRNGILVEEFHFRETAQGDDIDLNIFPIDPAQGDLAETVTEGPLTAMRAIRRFDIPVEGADVYEMSVPDPDARGSTVARFAVVMYDRFAALREVGIGDVTIIDLEAGRVVVQPNMNLGVRTYQDALRFIRQKGREKLQGTDSNVVWDVRGSPRYTEQTLKNGFNHREIVFRLPPEPTGGYGGRLLLDPGQAAVADQLMRQFREADLDSNIVKVSDQIIEFADLMPDEYAKMELLVSKYPEILIEDTQGANSDQALYTGHHAYTEWTNVLMWARANERIGINGERILHIEEIQSDWHQQGRSYGYVNLKPEIELLDKQITALWKELREMEHRTDLVRNRAEDAWLAAAQKDPMSRAAHYPLSFIIENYDNWLPEFTTVVGKEWVEQNIRPDQAADITRRRDIDFEINQLRQRRNQLATRQRAGAPDAPFKGNAWPELAMKRLIRMAIDEGFDTITWTTGDQQNDRYDLRQVTSWITWNPISEELEAEGFSERVTESELEKYVGPELADKLLEGAQQVMGFEIVGAEGLVASDVEYYLEEQMGRPLDEDQLGMPVDGYVGIDGNGNYITDSDGNIVFAGTFGRTESLVHDILNESGQAEVELRGDDLVVGGEGMRTFYDKLLVNITNKVARKLDKNARVKREGQEFNTADQDDVDYFTRRARTLRTQAAFLRKEGEIEQAMDLESELKRVESRLEDLKSTTARVHSLDITPQMKAAAVEPFTLFQGGRRGSITFDEQNKAVIRMTRARNMSTFLHESGHLYLELMADMAQMPGASDQVIRDFDKVLKFLGVEHRGQIGREHHEKFARSFEAYLREGKSPDPGLRQIFHAFSAWLRRIYIQLASLDVELNDEIRGVFDRMIATDAAIKEAEQLQNYVELFGTAEEMGVSPEAFEVYRRTIAEAHEEATMAEQRKMLAAMLREEQRWYRDERRKVEEEVRAEAHEMPVYRALAMLQYGKNPDGSESQFQPFKISKKSLLRLLAYSQETLKRLPRPWIYTAREGEGVDVDLAAKRFGFRDGLEMISQVMRSVPMETYIRQETDARMAERFPDPMTSGELQEGAMEAVHSEKRAQVLAAELRALAKRVKADRPIVEATKKADERERREAREENLPRRSELAFIKQAAKRAIEQMRVRDVRPHVYQAAERTAGRKAFEALERKDYQAAYKFKRQQIVNHEMYRAAVAARDAAEKHRAYLMRFESKRLRERMGKGGVLDRIDAALEHFNFRKISLAQVDREKAQAELIQALEDGTIIAPVTLLQRLRDQGQNYQDLTIEDLQGLRDVVAQLEHIGRAHFEALVMGEKKNIQETAADLAETVRAVGRPVPLKVGAETFGAAVKRNVKAGLFNILRPGALARILDDAEYGPFTKVLIEPIRRAYTEKMLPWFAKMEEDLAEIYRRHYDDAALRALNNERIEIKTMNETITRADMLSIALNWGNAGNRHALINGRHPVDGHQVYTEQSIREILSHMTVADWRFVQDMWDYIGSYYGDLKDENGNVIREGIASVEKRRRGVAPQQVEALPFKIRSVEGVEVELRGGYYPLAYDRRFSKKQRVQEYQDIQDKMARGSFVRAQTRAGSTHERVQNHGKVVRLGLGLIDRHLREVIRDIAIGDEVNFVKRVLDDVNLDTALQETGNNEALIQLNRWLADSAVGEIPAQGLPDQVFAYVRTGFTKAKLGWNLTTMFLQVTGFAQTAATIGTTVMMRGLGKYMIAPAETWKFIIESSAFMKQRYVSQSWNKDVMDTRAHLEAFPILGIGPTRSRRLTKAFARTLFAPIMAMQSQVDAVTWFSVYQDRMNEHQDHQRAVLEADAAVEKAQTSGFFSDRSAIERGTISEKTVQAQFVRIWTTLISYMMAKNGIAVEKAVTARRQYQRGEFGFGQAVKFAMDMLMLFTIEGILAAFIYGKVPDWDEDEDESVIGWTLKQTGSSFLSGIPFARETLAMQYGGGNTPIGGLARDTVNLYVQIGQGEIDEALLKSLNNVGGTLFHYPSTQTNRMIDTAWSELVEGEDRPAYEYLTGERGN